jgi:hypothetical protein
MKLAVYTKKVTGSRNLVLPKNYRAKENRFIFYKLTLIVSSPMGEILHSKCDNQQVNKPGIFFV